MFLKTLQSIFLKRLIHFKELQEMMGEKREGKREKEREKWERERE